MRTYPIVRPDGSLHAFEIRNSFVWIGTLLRLLRSANGVADVKRNYSDDDRIKFRFRGEPCVVNEPWGDSSRYWIGPEDPKSAANLDLSPLHEAFQRHRGALARAWERLVQ